MTADPAKAKAFYDHVLGWTISDQSDQPGMDYRMIAVAPGDFAGGVLALSQDNRDGGAFPTWLMYVGVDDVDATAEKIAAKGGAIHMAPFDIADVGRAAMVADPQGNPFYIMRGSSPADSTAFAEQAIGKCCWNELTTADQAAAGAFYTDMFGWTYPDRMPMGELGDYVFVQAADTTIGAMMNTPPNTPTGWQFYFRVPDIHAAHDRILAAGGIVHHGPTEVPDGDMIVVASDPEGVRFGAVARA